MVAGAPGGTGPSADPRTRLLDTLLEASQYGLVLLDRRLQVVWVSNAGAAALRYDPDGLIGRSASDFIDPSQSLGVLEAIGEMLTAPTGDPSGWRLGVRVLIRCGDGVSRDFEFGGRAVRGDDPSELMLVFLDVSERARLEDVLVAITEHDLERALRTFLRLASSQLRAEVGIALHPSLGGATYGTPDARPNLFDDLSSDRDDATVCSITSPTGALFGWFVVDRARLSPWGLETTERLIALLGLTLSNQATFSDLVDAAATDPLTGLSNRRVLDVTLVGAEATASTGWAMLYCDLDRFKSINDKWGHEAGDIVLRAVADRLRHVVRTDDLIARVGGDEFVILAQTDDVQAGLLADRVRESMCEPIEDEIGHFDVGVSVGLATARTADEVRGLLAAADMAMRSEKAARRAER